MKFTESSSKLFNIGFQICEQYKHINNKYLCRSKKRVCISNYCYFNSLALNKYNSNAVMPIESAIIDYEP